MCKSACLQRPITYWRTRKKSNRRGSILVLSALVMVVALAMVAFALDIGIIVKARTEAQRAADSAAMAAAWELVSDAQIVGEELTLHDGMRSKASEFVSYHLVGHRTPSVQLNQANEIDGDIVIGRLSNPSDLSEPMEFNNALGDNAITVRVRMLNARDTSVPLWFARILGVNSSDITAEATAIFDDNVVGFRTNVDNPTSGLMPFVVHVDVWQDLMDGVSGSDNWTYDPATGDVTAGPDGIAEISMFPGSGGSSGNGGNGGNQVAPGNFGTVDIGNSNNAATDLRRQVEIGPNQSDFDYHGGELKLDPASQTMSLNGDTGITASMESALAEIVGDGRSIMLYNQVTGTGNTANYTITGFVGIRVMDFDLNGGDKYIMIQPAIVADPTGITGGYGQSYFIGQPVRLVR